jgi:hypothetical protein
LFATLFHPLESEQGDQETGNNKRGVKRQRKEEQKPQKGEKEEEDDNFNVEDELGNEEEDENEDEDEDDIEALLKRDSSWMRGSNKSEEERRKVRGDIFLFPSLILFVFYSSMSSSSLPRYLHSLSSSMLSSSSLRSLLQPLSSS